MKPEDLQVGKKYTYKGPINYFKDMQLIYGGKALNQYQYFCEVGKPYKCYWPFIDNDLKDFSEIDQESPFLNIQLEDAPKHTCALKEYVGFTQTYKYCEECGNKQQWNP